MQNNKQIVRAHFSRHAERYAQHANVQKHMLLRLWQNFYTEHGNEMQSNRCHVMDVGCGPGDAFGLINENMALERYTGLDISAEMLIQAKQNAQAYLARQEQVESVQAGGNSLLTNLEWLEADAEQFPFGSQAFDLIISNATVQWFNYPQRTMQKMIQALKPGGALIFSTFGTKTFQELHQAAISSGNDSHKIGPSLYEQNVWLEWLNECTDVRVECAVEQVEMRFPSALAFLKHIQSTGANEASSRVWTPRQLRALMQAYEQIATVPKQVNEIAYEIANQTTNEATKEVVATYEIYYFWVYRAKAKK